VPLRSLLLEFCPVLLTSFWRCDWMPFGDCTILVPCIHWPSVCVSSFWLLLTTGGFLPFWCSSWRSASATSHSCPVLAIFISTGCRTSSCPWCECPSLILSRRWRGRSFLRGWENWVFCLRLVCCGLRWTWGGCGGGGCDVHRNFWFSSGSGSLLCTTAGASSWGWPNCSWI